MAKSKSIPRSAPATSEPSEEYIVAMIEKRKFNPRTGERESKEYPCTFNRVEWMQFQENGPRLGWFVNSIVEAPADVDTGYTNPGKIKKHTEISAGNL